MEIASMSATVLNAADTALFLNIAASSSEIPIQQTATYATKLIRLFQLVVLFWLLDAMFSLLFK